MDSPDEVTGPINLGNPVESTIQELAEKIIAMAKSKSKIVRKPLPQDDPVRRRPDITQAQKVLKWQPKVPLEDGLARTIDYFRALLAA
jgi:UDP-glucuronate decarboxylase